MNTKPVNRGWPAIPFTWASLGTYRIISAFAVHTDGEFTISMFLDNHVYLMRKGTVVLSPGSCCLDEGQYCNLSETCFRGCAGDGVYEICMLSFDGIEGTPDGWGPDQMRRKQMAPDACHYARRVEIMRNIPRVLLLLGALALSGCSPRQMAVNSLGDALAQGSSVYATDDDPELVGAALPFGLKTIESLLSESPHHKGLLLAATRGFTQYAYAFVQNEADFVEDTDRARARVLRERAGRLYRRALAYGLRGMDEIQPGSSQQLRTDPGAALAGFRKAEVPQLYWTAIAWGAAISLNKTDTELSTALPRVEALMHRARELDEGFELGAIHDFYIMYEGGRPAAAGGSVEQARAALDRAVQLSGGNRAAPLVSFAETVDVGLQDRTEFEKLLKRALAIDVNTLPEQRLANTLAQKRARWLLARTDRLFLE